MTQETQTQAQEQKGFDNAQRAALGYRELTTDEVALVKENKAFGVAFKAFIDKVDALPGVDKRWLSIGRTHFQEGLQAVTRSITRPDMF